MLAMSCSSSAEYCYDIINNTGSLLVEYFIDDYLFRKVATEIGYLSYIEFIHLKHVIREVEGYYE
jgi:hypothetical protein